MSFDLPFHIYEVSPEDGSRETIFQHRPPLPAYKAGEAVEARYNENSRTWRPAVVARVEGDSIRLLFDGYADTQIVPPSRIRPANHNTSAAAPASKAGTIQRKAPKWGLLRDSNSVYWFGAHDACDFEALREGDRVSYELRDNPNLAKRAQHPLIAVSVAKRPAQRAQPQARTAPAATDGGLFGGAAVAGGGTFGPQTAHKARAKPKKAKSKAKAPPATDGVALQEFGEAQSTDDATVDRSTVLARGQEVVYRQSDGTRRGATVTAVHHDEPPWYTVRLSDGSEKQTIRDRLELPPRDTGLADQVRCPITLEVMKDPVLASDGHTYERAAIEDWLRTHDTSPMTNARLGSKELMPNLVLRSIISGL